MLLAWKILTGGQPCPVWVLPVAGGFQIRDKVIEGTLLKMATGSQFGTISGSVNRLWAVQPRETAHFHDQG